jgi:hypothetical protein
MCRMAVRLCEARLQATSPCFGVCRWWYPHAYSLCCGASMGLKLAVFIRGAGVATFFITSQTKG